MGADSRAAPTTCQQQASALLILQLPGQLLDDARQLVHALAQRLDVLLAGNAQPAQRAAEAVINDPLDLLAGVGSLPDHPVLDLASRVVRQVTGLAFQLLADLDQVVEQLAALLLGAREGAEAGQPDLLRGVLDGAGQRGVEGRCGGLGGAAGFLDFLDHGSTPEMDGGRHGVNGPPQRSATVRCVQWACVGAQD